MKTEIGGYLTEEEIEQSIEDAKQIFSRDIPANFNSKPATFRTGIYHSDGRIVVTDKMLEDWHDFIPEEQWSGFGRNIKTVSRGNYAFLFPWYGIALILDDYLFEDIPYGEKRLKDMDYKVLRKPNGKYSGEWGNENKLELLKCLRSPEVPEIRAVDKRVYEILDALHSGLYEEPETYTFAIFTQKKKVITEVCGPGSCVFEDTIVIRSNPVKELVDVDAGKVKETLEAISKGLPLTRAIGLTSKVKTANGIRHIPMIDFDHGDLWQLKRLSKKMETPGIAVESGNFLHFYGFRLLDPKEWKDNVTGLGYSDGVDKSWSKHQINQGYSMLRLTPSRTRFYQPCLLECYNPDGSGNL